MPGTPPQSDAAAASAVVDRLTAELNSLAAVTLPAGLAELDAPHPRRRRCAQGIRGAAGRRRTSAMPRPGRPFAARRARAPLELRCGSWPNWPRRPAAVEPHGAVARNWLPTELERTQAELDAAIAARDKARAARDRARRRQQRGARCARTSCAGDACPVCEQTVATLPKPAHAPKLAAAEKAVAAADAKVQTGPRGRVLTAAQLVATAAAQLAAANERVSRAAVRARRAADRRRHSSGKHSTDSTGSTPRPTPPTRPCSGHGTQLAAAQAARAARSEADAADTPPRPAHQRGIRWSRWAHRRWTDRNCWRRGLSSPTGPRRRRTSRRQALPGAHAADDAAADRASRRREGADRRADAGGAGPEGRDGVPPDPTSGHKAALKGLQTRLGELTAALFDAPTDAEAQGAAWRRSTSSPPPSTTRTPRCRRARIGARAGRRRGASA